MNKAGVSNSHNHSTTHLIYFERKSVIAVVSFMMNKSLRFDSLHFALFHSNAISNVGQQMSL